MFDLLKQFQNEVNDIRSEILARSANPLALLAAAQPYSDNYYQAPKPQRSNAYHTCNASSTDHVQKQARRTRILKKETWHSVSISRKLYKPTNNNLRTSSNSRNKTEDTTPRYNNDNQSGQFGNQRTMTVVGARETVGSPVVQQNGIQCFNCKGFGHYARECRKPKRVKDYAYHKEKMMMCKQAEQGVPLQAEQADWLEDTDEEIDEQELEAHYSYMAKIQEVSPEKSSSISQPLEQVDQNAPECVDERVALANLIANLTLDTEENKTVLKQLKKANASLTQELKECKTNLDESSRALGEATSSRDSSLIALQTKRLSLRRLLAIKDIDIQKGLKTKTYEISVVNQKYDELVKKSLLTRSQFEGQLKEKTKVISDLKVKEGKDIDTMIEMDKQIKFLNEILYKRNQSIQTIHMLAPKCATYHGRSTFANPKYLKKAQSDKPRLYEIPYDTSDPANRFCPDGEDTVTLEKESRSKLDKDKVKHIIIYTYPKLVFMKTFKPPSQSYLDQLERANEVRKTICLATVLDELESEKMKTTPVAKKRLQMYFEKNVNNYIEIQDLKAPMARQGTWNTNPHMSKSSGVIHTTSVSRPQLKSYQVKEKVVPNISQVKFTKKEVEDHHRISSISKKTKSVTACNDSSNSRTSNANAVCAECGTYVFNSNHDTCVSRYLKDNDSRLLSRKSTCFVRVLRKRFTNSKSVASGSLNNISQETTLSTTICFMAKASPTPSLVMASRLSLSELRLPHLRLSQERFCLTGLPKMKYVREQLCSSCAPNELKAIEFILRRQKSSLVPKGS
ncbi:retrovirus-related pol polyprotein from transposon TNT 1-94 [Tanacetum coccineum]